MERIVHILRKWPVWAKRVWVLTLFLAAFGLVNSAYVFVAAKTVEVPAVGGTYYEAMVSRVQNINPYYCYMSSMDRDLCKLVFSGLTKYDPVSKEIRGDLAYSWTISDDGMEYNYSLRPDLYWHDGVPITSEDVVFSYQDILQSPDYLGSYQKTFHNVKIEALDERTIRFTLAEPQAFFPYTVTLGIVPKHILGGISIAEIQQHSFNRNPIGSGPFKLINIESERDVDIVELRSFEKYYGEQPYIQKLVLYGFSHTDNLLQKQSIFDGIRDVTDGTLIDASRFNTHQIQLPRLTGVFFNMQKPILKNDVIRNALSLSIDKNAIVAGLNNAKLIDSPLPFIEADVTHTTDIERAKELLFNADWKIYSEQYNDGIRRDKNGEKLSLILATTKSEDNMTVAKRLQAAWKEIGIEIEIVNLEIGDLQENIIKPRKYDVLLIAEELQESIDLYPYFHTSQMVDPGLNLSQYNNVDVNLLLDKIRATNTYTDQVLLTQELLTILNKDNPVIYLYSLQVPYYVNKDIINVKIPPQAGHISDRFNMFHEWAKDVTYIWE